MLKILLILLFGYFSFRWISTLLCLNIPKFKLNPSSIATFYGAPGSGKSTLAAYFAKAALKSGITVYSNLPIVGCRKFEKSDLGNYLMENCLILWDEVGVDANSRNFKSNFSIENIKFLKYHRHENAQIMVFSQGFDDMDKIIRTLSVDMYIVKKGAFNTITYRRIDKEPGIDENVHKPDDLYAFVRFSRKRIWARPIWKLFDSYTRLGLPSKLWETWGALSTLEASAEGANLSDSEGSRAAH